MGSTSQPPPPPLSNEERGRKLQTPLPTCHSRKISIGILPDSSSQSRPKDFAIQTQTTPTRSESNAAKDGIQLKQKQALDHQTSPWISTRSFRQKLPVAEGPPSTQDANPPVLFPTKPVMEKDNPVHTSKGGDTVRVEKVSFATMRSLPGEDLGEHPTSKAETKGSETLRMKLWEILGTVAPSNNEHGLDVETKNLSPLQVMDEEHVPAVKVRQNSDRLNMEVENMSPLRKSDKLSIPVAKPIQNSYCLHMESDNISPVQSNDKGGVPGAKHRQQSHHLNMRAKNMMQVQNSNEGHVPAIKLGQNSYRRNMGAENMSPLHDSDKKHVPVAKRGQKSTRLNMRTKNKTALQNDDEEAVPVAKVRQNSHCLKGRAKDMSSWQSKDQEYVPVAKPRQNSDTIETDSECLPDVNFERLRTRSLTRRKAAGRLKASKVENAPSTHPKKGKKGVNDSFILKEGFSGRLQYGISVDPKTSTRKISERCSPGITAHTLFSAEVENPAVNGRSEGIPSCEKSQLLEDVSKVHNASKGVFFQPKRVALEIESHMAEHPRKMIYSPQVQEKVSQAKEKLDIWCPTFGLKLTKERYFPGSPISKMKEIAKESSPGTPKKGGADDDSLGKPLFSGKDIPSFKSFFSSRSNYVKSHLQQEGFPDDSRQPEKSPPMTKSKPVIEDEPECRMSQSSSSSEDSDSHTSSVDERAKGFRKSNPIFPEIPFVEKSDFVLHLNKKKANASKHFPSLSSEREVDFNGQQQFDLNEEDGLPSAVSLFALALERVKSNMTSKVKKKSAEILTSVAEGIHSQLQIAESQIQADVAKLTSMNKLKRKRIDTRFEELQGQLKVIHARFMDEVNCHLQDCRSTLESLEAHQLELKATVEKQSISHKKLLLEAEEAIEIQLNDAQKRITEVHDLARKKMSQLKHEVAGCL